MPCRITSVYGCTGTSYCLGSKLVGVRGGHERPEMVHMHHGG